MGRTFSRVTIDSIVDVLKALIGTPAGADIATDIANLENKITDAVPEPPTAKSLHDSLHKNGSYTYDNTTDSQEAIADAVAAIPINKRSTYTNQFSAHTGDTALTDIINITGSGMLYNIFSKISGGAATTQIKITIDGVALVSATGSNTLYRGIQPATNNTLNFTAADDLAFPLNWEYKTSLIVQHKTSDGAQTVTSNIAYSID